MQGDEDVGKVAAAVPVIICIFASVLSSCLLLSLVVPNAVSVSSCNYQQSNELLLLLLLLL